MFGAWGEEESRRGGYLERKLKEEKRHRLIEHVREGIEKIEEDIYTNVKKNFYRELEFFWDKIFERINRIAGGVERGYIGWARNLIRNSINSWYKFATGKTYRKYDLNPVFGLEMIAVYRSLRECLDLKG